jgi:hypothetical protein
MNQVAGSIRKKKFFLQNVFATVEEKIKEQVRKTYS